MAKEKKEIKLNRDFDNSFDEMLLDQQADRSVAKSDVIEVDISKLEEFPEHPYNVNDDESMEMLANSIKDNGLYTPIRIWPNEKGTYYIIAGHRRVFACKKIYIKSIQAIVRHCSFDEAVIEMVDSNIQREEILPSERARAYKKRFEAMTHQGRTSGHDVPKLAVDEIGDMYGMSGRNVKRYIRLLNLLPELLDMVDKKILNFSLGVELSFLEKDIQKHIFINIRMGGSINEAQIKLLRKLQEDKNISDEAISSILKPVVNGRKSSRSVSFKEKELNSYFTPNYSAEEMHDVIIKLLTEWKEQQEGVTVNG